MNTVTQQDIDKLPKRFRQYIANLRIKVEELQAVQASKEKTMIQVEPYSAGVSYLNDRATVRYIVGRTSLDVNLRNAFGGYSDPPDSLCINGSSTLNIQPSASNQIYIVGTR